MRITVLGGAGKMGCIAVQTLANDPRVDEVVIADVNQAGAQVVADFLGSPKVTIRPVDLNQADGLVAALRGSAACVNATVYYTNLPVMAACLEARVPYVDLGGLFHTTRKQLELDAAYRDAGVAAVLGMGSAPGVPNVQSRYAADRLDRIDSIRIYDGVKPPPPDQVFFTYAVPTILDEMTMEPMVFRDGQFLACEPISEFEDYWFPEPIGLQPMHLSLHSEVATLPVSFAAKGIKECFFKINFWGMARETVEKIQVLALFGFNRREPVDVRGQAVVPRDVMLALLSDRVPPVTDFLKAPGGGPNDWQKCILTEVHGAAGGREVVYRVSTLTRRGAQPTGAAPAITAIWLAQGRVPPGVHPPELALEPEPFLRELEHLGMPTTVSASHAL